MPPEFYHRLINQGLSYSRYLTCLQLQIFIIYRAQSLTKDTGTSLWAVYFLWEGGGGGGVDALLFNKQSTPTDE